MQSAKRQKLTEKTVPLQSMPSDVIYEGSNELEEIEPLETDVENNESVISRATLVGRSSSNDQYLKDLLENWGALALFDNLHNCGITFKNLHLLEESDYGVLIQGDPRMLGNLIIFRDLHRKWKVNATKAVIIVNIRLILDKGGEVTQELTSFFENHGKFTHSMRVKLVDLILEEGHDLPRPTMSNIADQIVEIFPGELQRYYYEKLPGKSPTGILYKRYNDLQLKKDKPTVIELPVEDVPNEVTDEARSNMAFLNDEKNCGEDISEEQGNRLIKLWKATFPYRNYKSADDWLPLRKPFGDVLIHFDFEQKYGTHCADSYQGFERFVATNEKLILEDIRNAFVRKEVEKAFADEERNTKLATIVMGLFNLSCMVPFKVSTKKKTWTPTIDESKKGFCVTVKRFDAMSTEIRKRKLVCEAKGMKEHPMIYYVSDTGEYFVRYRLYSYRSKNGFIDAVDTAFKMYILFDVPFPGDSYKIWHFFNHIFYKVNLKEQANSSFISKLSLFKF